MYEIRHRVGIKAARKDIYDALYQPGKLAGWWAAKAEGGDSSEPGSRIRLEFPGFPDHVWEIADSAAHERLHLKLIEGPGPWHGSELIFELTDTSEQVFVTLTHVTTPDTPEDAFQYFCTKWPTFLVSLKDFLETGQGMPYPDDIKIQHDQ